MKLPQFMIDNPNWMNTPDLGEVVYVNYAGTQHHTTNGIHLSRWLREGGQLVEPPEEEAPVEEAPPAHTAKKAKE